SFLSYSLHLCVLHSFPTRRSSDLHLARLVRISAAPFQAVLRVHRSEQHRQMRPSREADGAEAVFIDAVFVGIGPQVTHRALDVLDRKSTRLNSSHLGISYAVFCLK